MGKEKRKAKELRYAGVDIGGTKLLALVVDGEGRVLGTGRTKTKAKKGFESVLERVVEVVDAACAGAGVERKELAAVGVGAPSPILPDGTAVNAPNMGWDHLPLVPMLERQLGVPVFAENDGNAGAYGEYCLGAGKGAASLVGLFVGTGLGGGIVLGGEILRGANCQAAEVGHMIVESGGRRCGCGHLGCLEAYASKTGMGRRFAHEILYEGRASLLLELCEFDPARLANVRSSALAQAWKADDEVACETLLEAARYLGLGAANLITLLGPEAIVLGGGVMEALGTELLPTVREAAAAATHPPGSFADTRIVLSKLGDNAIALGAFACARARLGEGGEKE